MPPKITSQKGLKCLICKAKIFSNHRHDFVCCNCPGNSACFVDGGHDYFRYGYGDKTKIKVISRRLPRQT